MCTSICVSGQLKAPRRDLSRPYRPRRTRVSQSSRPHRRLRGRPDRLSAQRGHVHGRPPRRNSSGRRKTGQRPPPGTRCTWRGCPAWTRPPGARSAAGRLRQLVGDHRPTGVRPQVVLVPLEDDVGTDGVGVCLHGAAEWPGTPVWTRTCEKVCRRASMSSPPALRAVSAADERTSSTGERSSSTRPRTPLLPSAHECQQAMPTLRIREGVRSLCSPVGAILSP